MLNILVPLKYECKRIFLRVNNFEPATTTFETNQHHSVKLKILFKGSYPSKSDATVRQTIEDYAEQLAVSVINQNHILMFDGARELDMFIANKIFQLLGKDKGKVKEYLIFLLPKNCTDIPEYGVVKRRDVPQYWSSERTYIVSLCDILITIGGSEGTADCIEKAMLCKKPVFIAHKITGYPREVWERYYIDKSCYYIQRNDAEYTLDYNLSIPDFYTHSFHIINKYKVGFPKYFFDREHQKKVIEKWRELVATGKLNDALKHTIKISERVDRGLMNQLILLQNQIYTIDKEESLGIAERHEETNRIAFAYLNIVNELEDTI